MGLEITPRAGQLQGLALPQGPHGDSRLGSPKPLIDPSFLFRVSGILIRLGMPLRSRTPFFPIRSQSQPVPGSPGSVVGFSLPSGFGFEAGDTPSTQASPEKVSSGKVS